MGALAKSNNWTFDELISFVSEIVTKESGNILTDSQRSMVESRIKKRLIDLGDLSPQQYHDYYSKNTDQELKHLVSLLTTHHTFFFREFCHFEFLLKELPALVEKAKKRGDKTIRILSAACSYGHEVYSLSMFLNEHLKAFPGIKYKVTGYDIDEESVKTAKNGVYLYSQVKSIPSMYLSGNWQRGTGDISRYAKVKANIKDHCDFHTMNLLGADRNQGQKKFDVIFCRNVFIYFEQDMIKEIVGNLRKSLFEGPGSYLITGVSESIKSLVDDINIHSPSVYSFGRFEEEKPKVETGSTPTQTSVVAPKPVSLVPDVIRMLIVDDSKSVVKLLTKIFEKDPGFEVVGAVHDGAEVEDFLKNNKVDAMTLDIHMPEMDGVSYLKNHYKPGHPHVVVVSSASREDTTYAQKTLEYGACDFVEKPSLNNIAQRSDEIKNKIKMAFFNQGAKSQASSLDKSFENAHTIENLGEKGRVFFASISDKEKIVSTFKSLKGSQPASFLFFEGNENFLEGIEKNLSSVSGLKVYEEGQKIEDGGVYLCDFAVHFDSIYEVLKSRQVSVGVFGICSALAEKKILQFDNSQLMLEDVPGMNEGLKEVASDIFPWTSFAHLGTEFLSKKK